MAEIAPRRAAPQTAAAAPAPLEHAVRTGQRPRLAYCRRGPGSADTGLPVDATASDVPCRADPRTVGRAYNRRQLPCRARGRASQLAAPAAFLQLACLGRRGMGDNVDRPRAVTG